MKYLNERNINTITIALLLLFLINMIGCGPKTDTTFVTQMCSVVKYQNEAVISCPDGSTVTLPPDVISEIVFETPIIIEVRHNDNNGKKCKKD